MSHVPYSFGTISGIPPSARSLASIILPAPILILDACPKILLLRYFVSLILKSNFEALCMPVALT